MTATVEAPPLGHVQSGYRTQAVAHLPDGWSVYLGGIPTKSPRLAMRWMRERAGHVADQLDESHARPLHSWLNDRFEHQRALEGLARGESYIFRAWDEEGVLYAFTAEPTAGPPVPRPYQAAGGKAA